MSCSLSITGFWQCHIAPVIDCSYADFQEAGFEMFMGPDIMSFVCICRIGVQFLYFLPYLLCSGLNVQGY